MTRSFAITSLVVGLLVLGTLSWLPFARATYLPGVSPGNTWTYGNFNCSGRCGPFENVTTATIVVTGVSGSVVTGTQMIHSNNGTTNTASIQTDVATGTGNATELIIAGGLSVGDTVPGSGSAMTINAAAAVNIAGAVREVNIAVEDFSSLGLAESVQIGWDRISGVTAEISITLSTGAETASITSTNIWPASSTADFTINSTPLTANGVLNVATSYTLAITSVNTLSGTVSLSASSTPSGPTVTLGMPSVTLPSGGSQTVTLTVDASTTGNYTINVVATEGSLSHSVIVSLIVQPHFTLDLSPLTATVPVDTNATSTITLTSYNGLSGLVYLVASTTTIGATVYLNGSTIPYITLTLAPGSPVTASLKFKSTVQGNLNATVVASAISGTSYVTRIAFFQVTVTGPPDFTIATTPPYLTVVQGTSGSSTVTVSPQTGFSGKVSLAASVVAPVANGPTVALSASSVQISGTAQSVSLTVSTSALTPANVYTITVAGNQTTLTHSATIYLLVTTPPPLTLTSTVSASSVAVGTAVHESAFLSGGVGTQTGTVTYRAYSGAFCNPPFTTIGTVAVVASNVPPSSNFTPSSVGTYAFDASYTGTGSLGPVVSPCVNLTATKTSPTLSITLSSAGIYTGGTAFAHAALTNSYNAGGTVTYYTYAGSSCAGAQLGSSQVILSSGSVPDSPPHYYGSVGAYSWNAVYSSDANNNAATSTCVTLQVNSAADFAVQASVASVSVNVGSSGTSTLSITPENGFSGTVTLATMITPASGLTCDSIPSISNSYGYGYGTSQLKCTASTAGTYSVVVTASSGSLSHQTTITYTAAAQTATNPASQNILGLDPTAFYSVVGVAIAAAIIGGGLLVRRRKTPSESM